jgi:hypothetical protein
MDCPQRDMQDSGGKVTTEIPVKLSLMDEKLVY